MVSWPRLHREKIQCTKFYEQGKINNTLNSMGKSFKSVCFNYPFSKNILNKINFEINQRMY